MSNTYQITHNHGLDIKGVRAVYSSPFQLESAELFSGNENDPVYWAHIESDNVSRDDKGMLLPYDITVSFYGLNFDRNKCLAEELGSMKRRMWQKAAVHIVVFDTLQDYCNYMDNEHCLIHQD